MYPNQAFSSGSYMDMFTANPLLPHNYYNESAAAENEAKFNTPIGDTVTMQSIDEHSNACNSHVDGEQNIQHHGLSLSLGTLLPSTSSVPPFQYQYHDTGFISLMNACLPKGTAICNDDDDDIKLHKEFKSSECIETISSGGFHDITKRESFHNPHPSDQCLQGSSGFSNIFLNSQYLKATQELLDEIVNVRKQRGMEKQEKIRDIGLDNSKDTDGKSTSQSMQISPGSGDPNSNPGCELPPAKRQNLLNKKTKLLSMLDEVDKRYKQYCYQMQIVVSSLDMAAGCGAAEPYTTLALRTISRHFRCLRDTISSQIQMIQRNLGEQEGIPRLRYVDQQLRQQKALQHLGVMRQAWRPQRGLPENSVSILRAWLFEHFLNPYPKDSEKIMLARQTGLTRNQVANWFINARVRLWKPMVEEIYKEEFGGLNPDLAPSIHPFKTLSFSFSLFASLFCVVDSNSNANTTMRKGAKRKTKHTEDSKPDSEPLPSSQENDSQISKPKPKRLKTSKPQSEPEYFEDKRNLEDLWLETFPVGTEWDQLDAVYQIKWNFSNLENAFEEGGLLYGKKVYLFGCTEPQLVMHKGENKVVCIPVVVAVVSPFPPSDKIGINSVQREAEEIIPMKQMKMDWVPYIPLEQRDSQVDRLKSQIFILRCTQRRSALKHLKLDRLKKYEYCLPYFYQPFKEDEFEQSTEVPIIYPVEPKPVFCEFDWELDELEEFTDKLIEAEELAEDQKDAFKEFVREKVREAKKANREAREARKKAIAEMSAETKAAFDTMRFYKFYPVQSPDAPDVSGVKSPFINRYYGKAHEVL